MKKRTLLPHDASENRGEPSAHTPLFVQRNIHRRENIFAIQASYAKAARFEVGFYLSNIQTVRSLKEK